MKTHCVYLLYADGVGRYIGVTNCIERRKKGHIYESYHVDGKSYNLAKSRWIRKIDGKFSCRILHTGSSIECYHMEEVYITECKNRNWPILNLTNGGDRPSPINESAKYEEIKRKISIKAKGRVVTDKTKARMKASAKAVSHEHLRRFWSRDTNPRRRSVVQFGKDGTHIRTWPTIKDASESLGCLSSGICEACRGNQKTAHGYKWKYVPM